MIFTTRQLQDLHKSNGHVTLPVGSRVTPLANDWLRQKRIKIEYGQNGSPAPATTAPASAPEPAAFTNTASTPTVGGFLWWCDGPCGASKAALAAEARETNLQPIDIPAEAKQIVKVVKRLASEIKNARAAGGVLLVQSGAAAIVYANRCPSIRAILGTCRASVEQGVQLVAANVLIIEHPYHTLPQVRNMLSRFLKASRNLRDEVKQELGELTSCA